jgi:hypothetical protein
VSAFGFQPYSAEGEHGRRFGVWLWQALKNELGLMVLYGQIKMKICLTRVAFFQ